MGLLMLLHMVLICSELNWGVVASAKSAEISYVKQASNGGDLKEVQ